LLQEHLFDFLDDDEALGGDAALPAVDEARVRRRRKKSFGRKHLAASDRARIPYEPIIQSMRLHKFGEPNFFVSYQLTNS
jgi:hypothetical protein